MEIETMLSIAIIICSIFSFSISACPTGSIQYYTDPTLCFFFEIEKQNFMTAEGICEALGGHLTSIHGMFENVFVSEQGSSMFTDSASSDFWIGANTLMTPGTWSWMDGTTFEFTDWDTNQPQNISSSNCGAITMENNAWISDDCNKKKSFVCLINNANSLTTTTTKPKTCLPSWTYYVVNGTTGYCYKVFDNATWINAEDKCKVEGAHLASVHTLDESLFLAYLAYWPGADVCDGYKMAWIGGYTDDNNAHWYWTDETPFNYTSWPNGHTPTNSYQRSCTIKYLTTECGAPASSIDNWPCERLLAKYICKKLPQ